MRQSPNNCFIIPRE